MFIGNHNNYSTEENIMYLKSKNFGPRIVFFSFVFALILIPFQTSFADSGSEGITLEKDVYLQGPILGAEDMPDEVTFSLYDSENAVVPLAAQSFPRGNYALDFEFNKSDGLSSGSVARFKVAFTNKLNLDNATEPAKQPKQIWAELSINDIAVGNRTRVPDNAMVQLLLASDASIATYLTLAYEGDDNPIATIYRELPLSSSAGLSATDYISSLFRVASDPLAIATSPYWEQSGSNIYYSDGNVGIGTTNPVQKLHVEGGSIFSLSATGGGVLVGEGLGPDQYGGYIWDGANNLLMFATASQNIITFGHNNGTLERMRIDAAGSVGIGTKAPAYNLAVNGSIGCKELTVTSTGWADFVFKDGYKLPPIEEVEKFIIKNKHLPDIPSAESVNNTGIEVGKISTKLLQKIEELTLYVIDLKKENTKLKTELTKIQEQIGN